MERSTGAEPSLAVTRAEADARAARLEDLSTEPPAGPTVMQQAHRNGMRKALAMMKGRFADRRKAHAEETIRAGLVLYLREWHNTYKQGVAETPVSTVDRTILDIRRDTVAQILAEIGRQDTPAAGMPSSAHGARRAGDRPQNGLPPTDF